MAAQSDAVGMPGKGSRRRLDLRTRTEVTRLAARGQRHPQPTVSLKAYHWASDRLRVSPLGHELLTVVTATLGVAAVVIAMLLALHLSTGPLVAVLVLSLAGMCGWTLYIHRRVEQVARVNRPS